MCVYRRSIYLGSIWISLHGTAYLFNADGQRPDTLNAGFGESDDEVLSMRVTIELFLLHACHISRLKTTHLMQNEHPRPRT